MRLARSVFAAAIVGLVVGCATSSAPPYYYGDAGPDGGSGSGVGASGGGPGVGGSSGIGGAGAGGAGGSSAGGAGGTSAGGAGGTCTIAQCPNDGTGSPCCVSAAGPCGMDRGSGCVAPTGAGGSSSGGTAGAGFGGAGGGGFPCFNCQGTCKTLTDDSACLVDCVGNKGASGCHFENDVCTCIP